VRLESIVELPGNKGYFRGLFRTFAESMGYTLEYSGVVLRRRRVYAAISKEGRKGRAGRAPKVRGGQTGKVGKWAELVEFR
jgi:hypothetical protein